MIGVRGQKGSLPNTLSATFSPILTAGASRLPEVVIGNTEEPITLRLSVANSTSRGDREFDKTPAMLFPK